MSPAATASNNKAKAGASQAAKPAKGSGKTGVPRGWERAFYLTVYSLLVLCRIPQIIACGRFWAEEGSVFFSTACHRPWYQSLFLPYGGYLNLPANLGADIACHLTPLQWAPYATITLAFLLQALPAVLICTSKDHWINNRLIMAASLLALATAPMAQEVWLNTLESQVFLTLSCALILAFSCADGKIEWLRRATLFLAPLSGCTSVLLAPFFVLRAFLERSKQRFIQAGLIAGGSLLQVLCFALPHWHSEPSRYAGINLQLLLMAFFQKLVLIPLFGTDATTYAEILRHSYLAGSPDIVPLVGSSVLVLVLSIVAWELRKTPVAWLIVPGLFLPLASFTCALNPKTDLILLCDGVRYAFVGQVLLAIACFSMLKLGSVKTKLFCAILGGWILWVGIHQYHRTLPFFKSGPSWPRQVAAWRADHSKEVGGWPTGWAFQLDSSRVR